MADATQATQATHAGILADATPAFLELHRTIGEAVAGVCPAARAVVEYGIAGWALPVANPPSADAWKGTMPRTHCFVGPAEKKAGTTIHVWHPNHPHLLRDHEAMLRGAGFKVMVGCLQWNRKAPPPVDALAALLESAGGWA